MRTDMSIRERWCCFICNLGRGVWPQAVFRSLDSERPLTKISLVSQRTFSSPMLVFDKSNTQRTFSIDLDLSLSLSWTLFRSLRGYRSLKAPRMNDRWRDLTESGHANVKQDKFAYEGQRSETLELFYPDDVPLVQVGPGRLPVLVGVDRSSFERWTLMASPVLVWIFSRQSPKPEVRSRYAAQRER